MSLWLPIFGPVWFFWPLLAPEVAWLDVRSPIEGKRFRFTRVTMTGGASRYGAIGWSIRLINLLPFLQGGSQWRNHLPASQNLCCGERVGARRARNQKVRLEQMHGPLTSKRNLSSDWLAIQLEWLLPCVFTSRKIVTICSSENRFFTLQPSLGQGKA